MRKVITLLAILVSLFYPRVSIGAGTTKKSSPKVIKEWSYSEDMGAFNFRKGKSRLKRKRKVKAKDSKADLKKINSDSKFKTITQDDAPERTKKEEPNKKEKKKEKKKKEPKLSELDKKRLELKENEKQSLNFIFPSVDELAEQNQGESIKGREEFYSETEKDQLLELWRATIVRNRTIQFIVGVLAEDPNDIEKNNAVIQALSKAVYVPFYTLSTVSNNSLVNSGSMVGARVLGDIINSVNEKRSRTQQVTKTEMIVLFMLVDEVAQRLRSTYFDYKELTMEMALLRQEIEDAQVDAVEALHGKSGSAKFLTRLIVRNNEAKLRRLSVSYRATRKELMELSGKNAVDSVDKMLAIEVDSLLNDPVQSKYAKLSNHTL